MEALIDTIAKYSSYLIVLTILTLVLLRLLLTTMLKKYAYYQEQSEEISIRFQEVDEKLKQLRENYESAKEKHCSNCKSENKENCTLPSYDKELDQIEREAERVRKESKRLLWLLRFINKLLASHVGITLLFMGNIEAFKPAPKNPSLEDK